MPFPSPHLQCSICSQIKDYESATEYIQEPQSNTDFPEAVKKLKVIKSINSRQDLMQCPECKTYYHYHSHYEFLIGGTGSYDEYIIERISNERANQYLNSK